MGKSWIPLSGYKKISEDGQKATLRHPHGHEITLAKSLLSDNMKSQLSSLPLHGQSAAPQKLAQGGRVKKMANGGGLEVEAVDPNDDGSQANASQQQQTAPSEAQAQASPGPMGSFPKGSPYNMPPGALMDKAYNAEMQGVQGQANAESQGAMRQAQAITQGQMQMKQDVGALQSMIGNRMKELTDFAIDYGKQKINPNEFWEDKSTAGKVATGIGVLLGGLGQGLMGAQQNPVMQFIQEQIRNNIHAQVVNMDKKKTLFGMNMQMLGNQEDAMQMTMNQHLAALGMDVEKAGLQSKSAQAQAAAQQMKGQIWNEMSKNVMNWSLKSLMDVKGGYGGQQQQQGGGQPQGGMPTGPGGQQGPWAPGAATGQQPRLPAGDPRLSQMSQYMTPEERQRVVSMPAGGALMSNIPDAAKQGQKITSTHAALSAAIDEAERASSLGSVMPGTTAYNRQADAMARVKTILGSIRNEDDAQPGRLDPLARKGLEELSNFNVHHWVAGNMLGGYEKTKEHIRGLRDFNQSQMDSGYQGLLGDKYQPAMKAENPNGFNTGEP